MVDYVREEIWNPGRTMNCTSQGQLYPISFEEEERNPNTGSHRKYITPQCYLWIYLLH